MLADIPTNTPVLFSLLCNIVFRRPLFRNVRMNIVIKFRLLNVHSVKNVYVLNIFILLIIIMNWFKFILVLASKGVLEYRFAELFQK